MTASRIVLDTKRECSRMCGCYTSNGYAIRYKNASVCGVIFVCGDCFEQHYRQQCTPFKQQSDSSTPEQPCKNQHTTADEVIRCTAFITVMAALAVAFVFLACNAREKTGTGKMHPQQISESYSSVMQKDSQAADISDDDIILIEITDNPAYICHGEVNIRS